MDGKGSEKSELLIFCCKIVLLRSYGSFNNLVVLRHLELLMSAEKLQNLTICCFINLHQKNVF